MTDRVKGFHVVLEQDMRVDDVDDLRQCILMLRGVLNVTPSVAEHDDWMNRERIKREILEKIRETVFPTPTYAKKQR